MNNQKSKNKNILKKILTILIVFITIFQFFPPVVLAIQVNDNYIQSTEEINEKQESNTGESKQITFSNVEEKILGEDISKRKLNEKHFVLENEMILATTYPYNVHYKENGEFKDIDNSLQEIKNTDMDSKDNLENSESIYENKNNIFKIRFAKKSNHNKLVSLTYNQNKISWGMQDANKTEAKIINQNDSKKISKVNLKNISSGIMYENILPNIDIQYHIISDMIKEDIILKNKNAVEENIVFEYDIGNLIMEKMKNGDIIISQQNSETILFKLDTLYMYDANSVTSDKIEIELKKGNNHKYLLTIKPDLEWLKSEERKYPIVIDPTIKTDVTHENIDDTYIFDGDTGYPTRGEAHILRVGNNNKMKNPTRTLIKFGLPTIETGDQIIAAMLDICTYPDTDEWTPITKERIIDIHQVTTDWNESTANWQSMNDKYDKNVADYIKYVFDFNEQCKYYYFDITTMVKDWYVTGNNFGVMLKEHTEVYNAPFTDVYFLSSDIHRDFSNARPMVQMIYRNQTGLENNLSYHSQNLGRVGDVYTNDYNGNLTWVHTDTTTPGNRFPVTIQHVYNTNDKAIDIGYGTGIRLNLSQQIELITIDGKEYAKYIDEDGTRHYFEKSGNEYKNEDDSEVKLILENDIFILQDRQKNKSKFIKKQKGSRIYLAIKRIRRYIWK